jgi:hypothetical protein
VVVDIATAPSDSDSTHLESIAEVVEAHAAPLAPEANAAGIGSFRTYRCRQVAPNSGPWSGSARIKSDAFGSKTWRRRAPSLRRQPS